MTGRMARRGDHAQAAQYLRQPIAIGQFPRHRRTRQHRLGLADALHQRREISSRWHRDRHTALDLHNLLTVSEAIARAAIERKESRGGQYRDDYPAKDPEFAKFNFSLKKADDGSMQIAKIPIPEMPADLKAIIEEKG